MERARGTERANFNFAELEEIEEDLKIMSAGLTSIRARGFGVASMSQPSVADMRCGQGVCQASAEAVYGEAGLSVPPHGSTEGKRGA